MEFSVSISHTQSLLSIQCFKSADKKPAREGECDLLQIMEIFDEFGGRFSITSRHFRLRLSILQNKSLNTIFRITAIKLNGNHR